MVDDRNGADRTARAPWAYRLVALDLDGTLLDSRKEISARNRDAVRRIQRQGVHVVLATGRGVSEASEFADELGCDDVMVTAGGAALGRASDHAIVEAWPMDCATSAQVVGVVERLPMRMMAFIGNRIYTNRFSDEHFVVTYRVEGYMTNKIVCDDVAATIRADGLDVAKVFASGAPEVLAEALAAMRAVPGVTITSSGADNLEVMAAGVDKGSALVHLGERLGIGVDEMIAIGDSDNDTGMMRVVGMPVAMGNATADIKALTRHTTADCDHSGVAEAIDHFFPER